jgi:hypothetical protein
MAARGPQFGPRTPRRLLFIVRRRVDFLRRPLTGDATRTSGLQERQQVGVDVVGVHGCHAVRIARIDLERTMLEKLGG